MPHAAARMAVPVGAEMSLPSCIRPQRGPKGEGEGPVHRVGERGGAGSAAGLGRLAPRGGGRIGAALLLAGRGSRRVLTLRLVAGTAVLAGPAVVAGALPAGGRVAALVVGALGPACVDRLGNVVGLPGSAGRGRGPLAGRVAQGLPAPLDRSAVVGRGGAGLNGQLPAGVTERFCELLLDLRRRVATDGALTATEQRGPGGGADDAVDLKLGGVLEATHGLVGLGAEDAVDAHPEHTLYL